MERINFDQMRSASIENYALSDFHRISGLYKNHLVELSIKFPISKALDHSMSKSVDSYVNQKLPLSDIAKALFKGEKIEVHGIYPTHFKKIAHRLVL